MADDGDNKTPATTDEAVTAPTKKPAKKRTAKKTAAKKTTTKKRAAKKTTAKKTPAKKAATKKRAGKKTTTRKKAASKPAVASTAVAEEERVVTNSILESVDDIERESSLLDEQLKELGITSESDLPAKKGNKDKEGDRDPIQYKGSESMNSETDSHDKGFWVQIIMGIAVVILVFMYIRSVAEHPPASAAATATPASSHVAAKPVKKVESAAVAGQPAVSPAIKAETQQKVAVENKSEAAVVTESPAVTSAETASVAEESDKASTETTSVAEKSADTGTETASVAEKSVDTGTETASVAEKSVDTGTETASVAEKGNDTAAPAVTSESNASVEAAPSAASKTETQPATNAKAKDWLSKLGFGGVEDSSSADAKAAGVTASARPAPTPASVETKASATVEPAAASKEKGASEATPVAAEAQVAVEATAAEPAGVAAEATPAPAEIKETAATTVSEPAAPVAAPESPAVAAPYPYAPMQPPSWAKGRVEQDPLKAPRGATNNPQKENFGRMEEEQRMREVPEWLRERMEKIEKLRAELHNEMRALQDAINGPKRYDNDGISPYYRHRGPSYSPDRGYGYPGQAYPAYPFEGR